MFLFDVLMKLYLWGAAPVLFTALVALLPASALNSRMPGQFLDAWLLFWAVELFVAALGFQFAGEDVLLFESQIPASSSSGNLGPESDFYFGAVKGTSAFAVVAVLIYLFRARTAKSGHQDFQ
jgi:hypothetical protein